MVRLLFSLVLVLFARGGFACDCYLGDTETKNREAVRVFLGAVKSIEYTGEQNWFGDEHTIVTFSISRSWKGGSAQVVLETTDNGAGCTGYWFEERKEYLVYLYDVNGSLDTYYCGGVIPASDTELVEHEVSALEEIHR